MLYHYFFDACLNWAFRVSDCRGHIRNLCRSLSSTPLKHYASCTGAERATYGVVNQYLSRVCVPKKDRIGAGVTNLLSSPTVAGLCGLALSMIGFAFSTQYWAMILSRCAQGALNGNIGKFLLCYPVPLIAILLGRSHKI